MSENCPIPFTPTVLRGPEDENVESEGVADEQIASDKPAMRVLSVLFVDDDPCVREVIAMYLANYGHHVTVAIDGEDAMSMYQPGVYDVVLTDLSMPKMNGRLLADAVKRMSALQRVVMLTGLIPGDRKPGSIDLFLGKPISAADLASALLLVAQKGEAA